MWLLFRFNGALINDFFSAFTDKRDWKKIKKKNIKTE